MSEVQHRAQALPARASRAPDGPVDTSVSDRPQAKITSALPRHPDNERCAEHAADAGAGEILPAPEGFPAPPGAAAYQGLLGEIVTRLAPETEADPVAILSHLLVAVGAAIGRSAYFQIGDSRHHPNTFLLVVGDSARSRICCAQHMRAYVAPQPMLR